MCVWLELELRSEQTFPISHQFLRAWINAGKKGHCTFKHDGFSVSSEWQMEPKMTNHSKENCIKNCFGRHKKICGWGSFVHFYFLCQLCLSVKLLRLNVLEVYEAFQMFICRDLKAKCYVKITTYYAIWYFTWQIIS